MFSPHVGTFTEPALLIEYFTAPVPSPSNSLTINVLVFAPGTTLALNLPIVAGVTNANGNLNDVSFNALIGFGIYQPILITARIQAISCCNKLYNISPVDGS